MESNDLRTIIADAMEPFIDTNNPNKIKAIDAAADAVAAALTQDAGPTTENEDSLGKMTIFLNTNIKMTRGKAAAHAVHAALHAMGVHPNVPVIVLGAKPRDIENMRTQIRDAGRTELEPGTLTAGTDWQKPADVENGGKGPWCRHEACQHWFEPQCDETCEGEKK